MDNMSQEKKSVVNPIRRQILISGATSPLVLTLMARNASAALQRGAPSGAAPYSAAMFGSLRLDGTEIELGKVDDNSGILYEELRSDDTNRSYYGTPGTKGDISLLYYYTDNSWSSSLETEKTLSYYEYNCQWTLGALGTSGPSSANDFVQRYEKAMCSKNTPPETDWTETSGIYQKIYKTTDLTTGSIGSFTTIATFAEAVGAIKGLTSYRP